MTNRSNLTQAKIEIQAKLKAVMAKGLFSNRWTPFSWLIRNMLGVNQPAVNEDPDLDHSET